jgi:uncharacterized membrane protein
MKKKPDQQFLDNMSKDPGNWRGPIYFNRKDPRLSVPKLNPLLGWTLNFANPYVIIALTVILTIIIVSAVLGL